MKPSQMRGIFNNVFAMGLRGARSSMGRTGGKWEHFAKAGSGVVEMKRAWGGGRVGGFREGHAGKHL
jgi:hypothetical protein